MLPTLDELRLAHAWVTRRYDLCGRRDDLAFTRILAEAHSLALDEGDEIAALFFSMARRGKALADYWGPLTETVINAQLHARARRLTSAGAAALRGLRTSVAANTVKYEEVCDWFCEHTEPVPVLPSRDE